MTDERALAALRREIDEVDEKLVGLLNDRARIALQIGIAKGNSEVRRPEREKAVLAHIAKVSRGPLSDEGLATIFNIIIEVCRTIQYTK